VTIGASLVLVMAWVALFGGAALTRRLHGPGPEPDAATDVPANGSRSRAVRRSAARSYGPEPGRRRRVYTRVEAAGAGLAAVGLVAFTVYGVLMVLNSL
jgi:hypothetical protein